MLHPKEIRIEDKALLSSIMGPQENSILNFTTLYIWGGEGKIKYDIVEDCLVCFFYSGRDGIGCTYPVGNGNRQKAAEMAFEYMQKQGGTPRFILMPHAAALECEQVFPNKFHIYSDRNNADYIYETNRMIHLSGKDLHSKKNHVNAFLKKYSFTYERIPMSQVPECIELFLKWQGALKNHTAGFSQKATIRLLENVDALGVTLGGIRVDKQLIAFSAGEAVTKDCALIHLEYADATIRGAFPIMNQQFCANEWQSYSFVNREEDMGIEGLRKAKMAYRPVRLIEKYFTKDKGN